MWDQRCYTDIQWWRQLFIDALMIEQICLFHRYLIRIMLWFLPWYNKFDSCCHKNILKIQFTYLTRYLTLTVLIPHKTTTSQHLELNGLRLRLSLNEHQRSGTSFMLTKHVHKHLICLSQLNNKWQQMLSKKKKHF